MEPVEGWAREESLGLRVRASPYRRLLLTAAEHLFVKQWKRLSRMLDDHDPTNELGAAWGVKERLRMLLAEHEPAKIPLATGRLLRRRDRRPAARSHPVGRNHRRHRQLATWAVWPGQDRARQRR